MELLPQKGLVITRRRKKWKFAHFNAWGNCFNFNGSNPKELKNDLKKYFSSRPLILEVGAGTAQLSLELARQNPDKNYLAIDLKSDRLYTAAKQALEESLKNIAFLRFNLEFDSRHSEQSEESEPLDPSSTPLDDKTGVLEAIFGSNSVDEIWLTFPDPYPRKGSAKHRLTHSNFLQQYRKILKSSGSLKFKTDNLALFKWSLEQFVANNWQIRELSFDLHESQLTAEYKIMTDYEKRFIDDGILINFCTISA